MDSSQRNRGLSSAHSSRSRSSTKISEDITSLTSFNPFSEEDENEHSSYALVTSLFSKVKNTLAAPLASAAASTSTPTATVSQAAPPTEPRRPSFHAASSGSSNKPSTDRQRLLNINTSNAAPPVISLTPVVSEPPTYTDERPPSRNASYFADAPDGLPYGTAIPGFPIPDSDSRSIKTTVSIRRSASASKVIRRIRGEGNHTRSTGAYHMVLIMN